MKPSFLLPPRLMFPPNDIEPIPFFFGATPGKRLLRKASLLSWISSSRSLWSASLSFSINSACKLWQTRMFKFKIQPVQSNNSDLLALDSKKRATTNMRFSQYLGALATTTATATRTPKKQEVYISKTTTLQVHHALLYISLSSLHDHNVKKKIHILSRTGTQDSDFLFLFLNFDTVL